jgi:hypothetical protein
MPYPVLSASTPSHVSGHVALNSLGEQQTLDEVRGDTDMLDTRDVDMK